jgi:hypothetical protein
MVLEESLITSGLLKSRKRESRDTLSFAVNESITISMDIFNKLSVPIVIHDVDLEFSRTSTATIENEDILPHEIRENDRVDYQKFFITRISDVSLPPGSRKTVSFCLRL